MADDTNVIKQKIKGSYEEAKGALMEEWGKVTGDKKVQIKGGLSRAKGRYMKDMADLGERVEDALDDLKDREHSSVAVNEP